jgi:hypothetical protein
VHNQQTAELERLNLKTKFLTLTLLAALALAALAPTLLSVNGQTQATVIMVDAVGGTTDPTGTTTYADGTDVQLTATADPTFALAYWILSTDAGSANVFENPTTLTVAAGTTYTVEPVFDQIQSPTGGQIPGNLPTSAIIVVLASAGGTTSPAPGVYAIENAASTMLTAMANSGWTFSHWTICGTNTNHGGSPTNWSPTENPYNVNHGYGYTYYYQAVFTPVGSTEPTPTATPTGNNGMPGGISTEMAIIIALVVVIVVLLAAFGVFAMRKNKHP